MRHAFDPLAHVPWHAIREAPPGVSAEAAAAPGRLRKYLSADGVTRSPFERLHGFARYRDASGTTYRAQADLVPFRASTFPFAAARDIPLVAREVSDRIDEPVTVWVRVHEALRREGWFPIGGRPDPDRPKYYEFSVHVRDREVYRAATLDDLLVCVATLAPLPELLVSRDTLATEIGFGPHHTSRLHLVRIFDPHLPEEPLSCIDPLGRSSSLYRLHDVDWGVTLTRIEEVVPDSLGRMLRNATPHERQEAQAFMREYGLNETRVNLAALTT